MLEQLHSLTQRISHADLSVQNIGNCDYVLDGLFIIGGVGVVGGVGRVVAG